MEAAADAHVLGRAVEVGDGRVLRDAAEDILHVHDGDGIVLSVTQLEQLDAELLDIVLPRHVRRGAAQRSVDLSF